MDLIFNNTIHKKLNSVISLDSLLFLTKVVHCVILIIYLIFGFIGNILNIFLFTSPVLLRTSSSFYLLFSSISNLFVIIFIIPIRLSADGFDHDITSYSTISCKLISYIYYTALALPPYFTVLACIDRWAASCIQVRRRRFAKPRIAKRLIVLAFILCCLLYSYIFIIFTEDPNPPPPYCSIHNSHAIFGLVYNLVIYSLIPPFLMAFFSINIILNVRRKRNRIMPVTPIANTSASGGGGVFHQNRRQLSPMQVMLVCEAISECFFTLPFSTINFISIVVDNDAYFLTLYSFFRLLIFINYVSSFYVYTLCSKLYRQELKKLFQRIFHRP